MFAPMYRVILQSQPEKYYKKLNHKTAKRLEECFRNLEENPFCPNTKALTGIHKGKRRCRVGSLRIVYEMNTEKKIVHILAIFPRGDVYKKVFLL